MYLYKNKAIKWEERSSAHRAHRFIARGQRMPEGQSAAPGMRIHFTTVRRVVVQRVCRLCRRYAACGLGRRCDPGQRKGLRPFAHPGY